MRWRQISAIPAAPAMIGMPMHAPSRCTLGKIGSSPTKVILPPVSSGDSPSSCITERNSALMSKPVETLGVSDAVLVMMMVPLCGKWTAERVTALVISIVGSRRRGRVNPLRLVAAGRCLGLVTWARPTAWAITCLGEFASGSVAGKQKHRGHCPVNSQCRSRDVGRLARYEKGDNGATSSVSPSLKMGA